MNGLTSEPIKAVLGRQQEDTPIPTPGGRANPEFITDSLGEGHPRATREASRFTALAPQLVKASRPAAPPQAEVKVPKLRQVNGEWTVGLYAITGAITLTVNRVSKFRGKADLTAPSQTLADFMAGEGSAWTDFRDDDMPALLVAWADSVRPSPQAARWASSALAVAMAARAGIALHSLDHAFLGEEVAA